MNDAASIAKALGGARRAGQGWTCRCPSHEDRHASLSLTDKPGGGLLWHCHAGCSQDDVHEALQARGLLPNGNATGHHTEFWMAKFGEPVCIYTYQDAQGADAFYVCRYATPGGKEIRPWHRVSGGKLEAKAYPAPRPLYRLPELLADTKKPVLVVEGEKCADAAASALGVHYAVTTWAGGAKAVEKADLAPLAGRRVILWPDADEPGKACADELKRLLRPIAANVALIDPGERPKGWDVADAVDEGWTQADLLTFIEERALFDQPNGAGERTAESGHREGTSVVYQRLDEVQARPIEWVWPGRLAVGKLTLIAGHPGLGKSQLALSLAATVSSGGRWPDGSECARGSVLILSAEDDPEDTIVPRLLALGADLTRVFMVKSVLAGFRSDGSEVQRGFCLNQDEYALRTVVTGIGDCRLLVVDPVTAYLGEADSHVNAAVRAAIAPIQQLANEQHLAVACISHLRKNASPEAMLRVSGSLAFVAAARVAFLVARHPDDESKRVLLSLKSNLTLEPEGRAFHIEPAQVRCPREIATSRVVWDGVVTMSADDVMAAADDPEARSARAEAKDFLSDYLRMGPRPSRELLADAQEAGHAEKTVRRAAKDLGVKIEQVGQVGGRSRWEWSLP